MRERRFKKSRRPNRVFLVICEGDTEKTYVEALKQHFRLPITIKTKVSGNNISRRLINQYLSELGLTGDDDYRVIFIYDADVRSVVDKLSQLPGKLILTNPCIELWYLLHILNHTREASSESIVKSLSGAHTAWREYAKGKLSKAQISLLLSQYSIAIERSKRLKWPDNPSTNLGDFIGMLENERKC